MSPFSGVTLFVTVACVVAVAVAVPLESEVAADTANTDSPAANQSLSSRDTEDASFGLTSALETVSISSAVDAVKDTFLAVDTDKGHDHKPHDHKPHNKNKKKKPLGKHKKKKQTFKDKLLPLLLIPFVIQTMLIPMFIMNLKFLALKAMAVGKFAILLIIFNMMRSWSQNAHSTSIRGTGDSMLMAQNYGFSGVPEFGAFFNGR